MPGMLPLNAIESKLLSNNTDSQIDTATLQSQIEACLSQLTFVTQRIQQISKENDDLRQENALLRQQLKARRSA